MYIKATRLFMEPNSLIYEMHSRNFEIFSKETKKYQPLIPLRVGFSNINALVGELEPLLEGPMGVIGRLFTLFHIFNMTVAEVSSSLECNSNPQVGSSVL